MQGTQVWSLGRDDPLEKEMATHSSILASLEGYSPQGYTQSKTTECLSIIIILKI